MITSAQKPTGISWKGNIAVDQNLGDKLPDGIKSVKRVPYEWKKRLKPRKLTRDDVGPKWLDRKAKPTKTKH